MKVKPPTTTATTTATTATSATTATTPTAGRGSAQHQSALSNPTVVPKELPPPPPFVDERSQRAARAEKKSVLAKARAEKREHTREAVAAWIHAALGEVTLKSANTHGAQRNAFRAAERLLALVDSEGEKLIVGGVKHALDGDLVAAQQALDGAVPFARTFDARQVLRACSSRLVDAIAARALDALASSVVSAREMMHPRAAAKALLPDIEKAVDAHPKHALAFAALFIEAAHDARTLTHDHAKAIIKHAERLERGEQVPAKAAKILLSARMHELTGHVEDAIKKYDRVILRDDASERDVLSAHAALARIAWEQKNYDGVLDHAKALAKGDPIAKGVRGLIRAAVHQTRGDKAKAIEKIDKVLSQIGDVGDDDHQFVRSLLLKARRDVAKGKKVGDPRIAIAALGMLHTTRAAKIPLATIFEEKKPKDASGPSAVGAMLALRATPLRFLDPIPVPLADGHVGGMVHSILVARRGDATRATTPALDLALGLQTAARAFPLLDDAEVVVETSTGARPSDARLAAMFGEVQELLVEGKTAGVPTVDEARARLLAHGWRQMPGTAHLVKEGARIAFEEFEIAQTASFQLRLQTVDDRGVVETHGRSVHVGRVVFTDSDWKIFEEGFNETIERYQRVLHTPQGAAFQARDIQDVRSLVSLGRDVDEMAARRAALMELGALKTRARELLADLQATGKAPKGVMIFVEGIDAASKTTNGMNLKQVFEDAGYKGDWLSFKAPTDDERKQPWLARYRAHQPKEGEVFLADRTFLGDYAYNPSATPERMREMAKDVVAWQQQMRDEGVLVIKLLFDPRFVEGVQRPPDEVLWRPMLTFGKREARALIARDLLERAKGGGLSDEDLRDLQLATMGPGFNDLKSFHEGKDAMERFRAFATATDDGNAWIRVGTRERHDGRVRAYEALVEALQVLRGADAAPND